MRRLTKDDVVFTLTCEPEDIDVRGNVMCSGNDEEDRAAEEDVLQAIRDGNDWAWCCVKVTATWKGFEASTYLGCCSYRNEEEFKAGGYYDDMCDEALADLNKQVEETANALATLEE